MKSKFNRPPGLILRTGVMTFLVMTLAWLPQANAAVSEGAVIENVATVTWEDATNVVNPVYTATAYSQVTVNLVQAAVTLSGRPTGVDPGDTATAPIGQTVLSGATATYLYAVTANANGSDAYNFRTPNTGADGHGRDAAGDSNVVATPTVSWNLMAADGTTTVGGADPISVTLGSAIVAIDSTAADTLSFPGGSLSGFAVGDIVVVNGVDYRIAAAGISAGAAPNHATLTTETLATITFEANPNGSNTAPAFGGGAVTAGTVIGEQQLFRVTVTATVSPATATGTVRHDVYLDTAVGVNVADIQDTNTQFDPLPTVTISKAVRNLSSIPVSPWNTTNTLTANPGDILEYRLTIQNSGSTAENVVVTDPVPSYTALETFANATGYPVPASDDPTPGDGTGNGTDDIFAHIRDAAGPPAVTANFTMQATDDEGATVGSGDAAGVTATSTLTFYVGRDQVPPNTGPTVGGDIADSATVTDDVFEIYYRVRILP